MAFAKSELGEEEEEEKPETTGVAIAETKVVDDEEAEGI